MKIEIKNGKEIRWVNGIPYSEEVSKGNEVFDRIRRELPPEKVEDVIKQFKRRNKK